MQRHQYYETICGGAGAGADFDGQSAVHTHMTNSRLTDPEVLETRYPVLVEEFAIRSGSGGEGAHKGGDGTTRRIRFLRGDDGGHPLDAARDRAVRSCWRRRGRQRPQQRHPRDGTLIALKGCDEIDVEPGDVIVIETPGGGGFGGVKS